MNRLKLNVARMSPRALIAQADLSIAQLAPAPPDVPPVPGVEANVASLVVARDAAAEANREYEDAKRALGALKQGRNAAVAKLRTEHRSTMRALESKAKGDPVMLSSTAYPLARAKKRTAEPPAKVLGLRVRWGASEGVVVGRHRAAERTDVYEVQVSTGDPIEGPYESVLHPTATSWELTGLPSATRVCVRVRGHGPNGPGPWSEPVSTLVP